MKGILADHNIGGHLNILLQLWQSESWRGFWESLSISLHSFGDFGLDVATSDAVIWQAYQTRQVVLITANRNADTPDSLEETIRRQNSPDCLPVFTLADANRIVRDRKYAERVAVKLLEYFLEIDRVRGTGRLFVP